MKKQLFLLSMVLFAAMSGTAQTTRSAIDKSINDPKAAGNTAKADVLLIDQKKVADTLMVPMKKKKKKRIVNSDQ